MTTPTTQELLALAKKLNDHARECNFHYNDWAADMSEAAAILREFAAAPSAEEPEVIRVTEVACGPDGGSVSGYCAINGCAVMLGKAELAAPSAGAGAQEVDALLTVDLHAAANALLQAEAGKMPREDVPLADIAQTIRKAIRALAAPPSAGPGAQETECCGVRIDSDRRFCPKCGWEARTCVPAPPPPPHDTLVEPLTDAERNELDVLLAHVCLPTFTERERQIAVFVARAALASLRAPTPTGEQK